MYRHFWKPVMDFFAAFVGLVCLSPLFFVLVVAIKLDSRGPVLFKQKRVGKNKKLFNIYKFRTMRVDTPRDKPTHLLENPEHYITKVGKFLRKTSMDELPQIFNILFGQMSVIGPRPALWNQDDLVAERDKYNANSVRPGLTGWAQINGRDELAIAVKAALDGEYVNRMGFLFDSKCFFGTIRSVVKSDGVVEGGTGALEKEIGANSDDLNEGEAEFDCASVTLGSPEISNTAEETELPDLGDTAEKSPLLSGTADPGDGADSTFQETDRTFDPESVQGDQP